jgi:hypothetical protein
MWIWPLCEAKHAALSPVLTERSRRVWAATEAHSIGYGGILTSLSNLSLESHQARIARATRLKY